MNTRGFWVVGPLVLVGLAAAWLRWRGPDGSAVLEPSKQAATVQAVSAASKDPRMEQVMRWARDQAGASRLVEAYGLWATDPSALASRKLALGALLSEQALGTKLRHVLEAVQADPAPPEEDPLWPFIVESLAELWTSDNIGKGREFMLLEERGRAKRALVASVAAFSQSDAAQKLSGQQRGELTSDLVDLYAQVQTEQRAEIGAALRSLGGADLAEILAGRGLEPGSRLAAQTSRERFVAQGKKGLLGGAEDSVRPLPPDLEAAP